MFDKYKIYSDGQIMLLMNNHKIDIEFKNFCIKLLNERHKDLRVVKPIQRQHIEDRRDLGNFDNILKCVNDHLPFKMRGPMKLTSKEGTIYRFTVLYTYWNIEHEVLIEVPESYVSKVEPAVKINNLFVIQSGERKNNKYLISTKYGGLSLTEYIHLANHYKTHEDALNFLYANTDFFEDKFWEIKSYYTVKEID